MRMSKNFYYESPCGITGIAKHAGSEGHLRADMSDRNIGTWKDWNMELVTGYEVLDWKIHLRITILYPVERDGTVPMKPWKHGGGIAISRQQYIN